MKLLGGLALCGIGLTAVSFGGEVGAFTQLVSAAVAFTIGLVLVCDACVK
jgi:hypothetical protein